MSSLKYQLSNKKNEQNLYNNNKMNLKSLDYDLNENGKTNKYLIYNSYSIKNIFSSKKYYSEKIKDSTIKAKLDKKRNITSEKNLIIPDNIFGKGKNLKKKPSKISIKNENIYKNNSISLEPFSPRRILTIPTQNNHYGYEVYDNGNIELLDDPDIFDKFDGTKNNSVGPGRYNIIPSPRKRLIIDWSKNLYNKNINNILQNNIENIKELSKLDNLFLTNILSEENRNRNKQLKSGFSQKNIHKIKDLKKGDDLYKEKLLNYEKQKKKEQAYLGPGSYDLIDEFLISPKKERFQNFGSSKSRNMNSPRKENIKSFENNIKYYFLTEKNKENKKENDDKIKLYKNSKFFTYKLKAKFLKEKNIIDKKKLHDNMGPGRYEPEEQKMKKENKVGNFGFLEKRSFKLDFNSDKPWDCSYLPLEDWTKKFSRKLKPIKKPENILFKFNEEINNKSETINEKNNEENPEKEIKINIKYNIKRPGFGSDEPRFYIFQSQINESNGVGSYDLIPKRKNKEQLMPFIYSSERHNAVKYDNNPELGPGTYNNYNTFFQWNKKSYNAKIKDRIDEFKKLKI